MCEYPTLLQCHFFDLFNIPCAFYLDEKALEKRYHELLKITHPDRFVSTTGTEKHYALSLATRINEAWKTLKNPLKRAHYLLLLKGIDLTKIPSTLSQEFLSQQITWQENIYQARQAITELKKLSQTLHQQIQTLANAFDQALLRDPKSAITPLQQWQFFARLQQKVEGFIEEAKVSHSNPL